METAINHFDQYRGSSAYDEFIDQGKPRPHVVNYHDAMLEFDEKRFNRRWQRASRVVEENSMGLAGHLSSKVSGSISPRERRKIRAWQLDAVPTLIDAATWSDISEAVAQRAKLNELLLQDLYGPQRLIREKVIPAKLLHSHPEFLRAVHGGAHDQPPFLQLVAFDMARSADGRWWFLSDRAESPSGIGFAHENRLVLSEAFPEIYRRCNVAQLSPFFSQLQQTLLSMNGGTQKGRGVLLGEGISGSNFFEEAYLARTLGYTLVQGDDLTVRNDGLYFKTLAGLNPVDLVLRRKNSRDCDPLEFDGSAVYGTPGLVSAMRQHQVVVANRLGAGLIEARAFMAYGNRICKALLSEELKIPSVATWWCGDPQTIPFVLNNLDRLRIEVAFRNRGAPRHEVRRLNELPVAERKAKILENPEHYVAQETVDRSSVPIWDGTQMQSARLAIRTFAVSKGDDFEVMQGGLGRTSLEPDPLHVSMRLGEGGKDIWVQSSETTPTLPELMTLPQFSPSRRGFDLSSRSADNLFWLGRQIERIYFSARVLRSTIQRLVGEVRSGDSTELRVLVRFLAMQGQLEPGYALEELSSSLPPVAEALPTTVLNDAIPGSLATAAHELLRIGQMERNFMSLDTWRTILRIAERTDVDHVDLQSLLTIADELVVDVSALAGLTSEGMTRDHVFRFIQIGRRFEHSTQILFLLRSFFVPQSGLVEPMLKAALEVADSQMTYRSRYFANYQVGGVLDLLVTDESNPRSLVWQLLRLDGHIEKLPGHPEDQRGLTPVSRLSNSLVHSVRTSDIQSIAESALLGDVEPFKNLLDTVESHLPELQLAMSNRYFVHADTSRQIIQRGRNVSDARDQP